MFDWRSNLQLNEYARLSVILNGIDLLSFVIKVHGSPTNNVMLRDLAGYLTMAALSRIWRAMEKDSEMVMVMVVVVMMSIEKSREQWP